MKERWDEAKTVQQVVEAVAPGNAEDKHGRNGHLREMKAQADSKGKMTVAKTAEQKRQDGWHEF